MNSSKRMTIYNVAKKIRKELEVIQKKNSSDFSKNLCGLCFIGAYKLHYSLKKFNVKTSLCYSYNHGFVSYRDVVIDVTATQFGKKKIEINKNPKNYYWNVTKKFKTSKQFVKFLRTSKSQCPDRFGK